MRGNSKVMIFGKVLAKKSQINFSDKVFFLLNNKHLQRNNINTQQHSTVTLILNIPL